MKNKVILMLLLLLAIIKSVNAEVVAYIDVPSTTTNTTVILKSYQEYKDDFLGYGYTDDQATSDTIISMSMDWIEITSAKLLNDYHKENIRINGNFVTIQDFDENYWSLYAYNDLQEGISDLQTKYPILEDWINSGQTPEQYYNINTSAQNLFYDIDEFSLFTSTFPTTDSINVTIINNPTNLSEAYNSELLEFYEFPLYIRLYVDEKLSVMGHSNIVNQLRQKDPNILEYSYAAKRFMIEDHASDVTLSTSDAATSWTIITNSFLQSSAPPPLDQVWP